MFSYSLKLFRKQDRRDQKEKVNIQTRKNRSRSPSRSLAFSDSDNDLDNLRYALVSSWSSDDEDADYSDTEDSDDEEDGSEATLFQPQSEAGDTVEDHISDTESAYEEMKQEIITFLPNNEVFDTLYHDQEDTNGTTVPNNNVAVHVVETFDKYAQGEGKDKGYLDDADTRENITISDLERNKALLEDNEIEAFSLENGEETPDTQTIIVDTEESTNLAFVDTKQESEEPKPCSVVPVIVIEENELHEKTDDVKYDPTEHCRSIIDIIISDAVGLVEGFRAIQSDCINIETELMNVFLGNQSFTESDSSISIEQSDSQASDVPVSELSLKDASIQEKDSVEINNVKNVVDEDIESENDDLDVLSCVTRTKWYKEFIKQKRISTTRLV